MTKFTKGPWPVVNQFTVIIGDGDIMTCSISTQHTGGIHSTVSEREANAHLISAAPDLCEENEKRARLIGEVYTMLLQGQTQEAIDLIYETETIDYSDGPMAISPALAKARGEA